MRTILLFIVLVIAITTHGQISISLTEINSTGLSLSEGEVIKFKLEATGLTADAVVDARTSNITAIQGSDFKIISTAHVLKANASGNSSCEIHIELLEDQVVEDQESFWLQLNCPAMGVKLPSAIEVKIIDNDKSMLSVSSARASEGEDLVLVFENSLEVIGGFEVKVEAAGIDWQNGKPTKPQDQDICCLGKYTVHFKGDAKEKQELRVHIERDRVNFEPEEQIMFNLIIVGSSSVIAPTSVRGVIEADVERRGSVPASFRKELKAASLSFFGDGALQSTFQNESDLAANTGIGIRWIEHFPNLRKHSFMGLFYRVELEASVNIASTADSVKAAYDEMNEISNRLDFGNTLLIPKSSAQSADIRLTLFTNYPWGGLVSGIHFRYNGANWFWQRAVFEDSDNFRIRNDQINTNILRVQLFHEFVNHELRDDYSAQIKLGYVRQWIGGDLALGDNRLALKDYLGSDQISSNGLEFGMSFRLENLEAEVSYTHFYIRSGQMAISGLHAGRLVTTIRFVGGFKAKLKKD